jgi:hypothetical protein
MKKYFFAFFFNKQTRKQNAFFFYNDRIYKNIFFLEDLSNAHKIKLNIKFDVIFFFLLNMSMLDPNSSNT